MTGKKITVDLLWLPNLFLIPLFIVWVLGVFGFVPGYWICFWLNILVRWIIKPVEMNFTYTEEG